MRIALALAVVLLLAACGGGRAAAPPATPTAAKHVTRPCPGTQKALKKIGRDLTALRKAAALPTKNRLIGNHAINVATDRFLNDVLLAPLNNLQRNRLIDHAMAALIGNCEQCFQAFEAARPIPAIRAGESKCPKG